MQKQPFHLVTKQQLTPEEQARLDAMPTDEVLEARELWQQSAAVTPDYSPDVDAGWARLKARMDGEATLHKVPRPRTARVVRMSGLRWAATIAASLLLLVGAAYWLRTVPPPVADMQTINTNDEPRSLTLPDGSTVMLNHHSTLVYPATFSAGERRVVLQGEAYFDVEHDPARPFTVEHGRLSTRVTGTEFNIRHYEGRRQASVYVHEGSVKTGSTDDDIATYTPILPSQQLVADLATRKRTLHTQASPNALAWRTRRLAFERASLTEVASTLSQQFGVEVSLENAALANCNFTYTGVQQDDSLSEVIAAIEAVFGATAIRSAEGYTIQGGTCAQ